MVAFLMICSLLIPAIMLIAGEMMLRHPPKKINWIYGYRTSRSMQNEATWAFAHAHCGRLWRMVGGVLLGVSVLAMLPFVKAAEDTFAIVSLVLMLVQLAVLIASIFPTERALKRQFPHENTSKS